MLVETKGKTMTYSDPRPADLLFPEAGAMRKMRLCPFCGVAISDEDFRDEISRRESHLSGLCQTCQDRMFS